MVLAGLQRLDDRTSHVGPERLDLACVPDGHVMRPGRVHPVRSSEQRATTRGVARVDELLSGARNRGSVHLGALDRAHRSGDLDRDASESALERAAEEVDPIRRHPAVLRIKRRRTSFEAERLVVLADAGERDDRGTPRDDRLQYGDVLV